MISRLPSSEISILLLVSVAEQGGLNLTFSETPKTSFLAARPICGKATLILHISHSLTTNRSDTAVKEVDMGLTAAKS